MSWDGRLPQSNGQAGEFALALNSLCWGRLWKIGIGNSAQNRDPVGGACRGATPKLHGRRDGTFHWHNWEMQTADDWRAERGQRVVA